jgi:hypothetical protein
MSTQRFRFLVHEERLAICRLAPDAPIPAWARGKFLDTARTPAELSIVCAQQHVPRETVHERDKVALGIEGTIPMTSVGILATLCGTLAEARVPVFVLSTYDTDWLLVSADRMPAAKTALESAGHEVSGAVPRT